MNTYPTNRGGCTPSIPMAIIVLLMFLLHLPQARTQPCTQGGCLPGWCQQTHVTTIPNPCPGGTGTVTVTYTYCYPDPLSPVSPKTQVIINQFNVSPPLPCPIDFAVNLKIQEALLSTNPQALKICQTAPSCSQWCDDHPNCFCPGGYAQWEVKSASCMKPQQGAGQSTDYFKCGTGYCTSVFEVCCKNGVPNARWLASSSEGSCNPLDPLCVPVCVSTPNPEVGCCDDEGNNVPHCDDGRCPWCPDPNNPGEEICPCEDGQCPCPDGSCPDQFGNCI